MTPLSAKSRNVIDRIQGRAPVVCPPPGGGILTLNRKKNTEQSRAEQSTVKEIERTLCEYKLTAPAPPQIVCNTVRNHVPCYGVRTDSYRLISITRLITRVLIR